MAKDIVEAYLMALNRPGFKGDYSLYKLKILLKTKGRCWYCGCQLNGRTFTIDHKIPKSMKGSNALENLLPACVSCNTKKGNSSLDQFRISVADGISFSETQVAWLREHGFNGKIPVYQFYGERIKSHDPKFLEEKT